MTHRWYNIIASIVVFSAVLLLPVQGQSDFFYDVGQPDPNVPATTDLGNEAASLATQDDGIFVRLMELFGVYSFTNDGTNSGSAVAYIQYIINILLGVAAFVALIVLVYGFYLMFFSKQEEGFDKAKKIVIGVIVALFIMGLARIVIRFFFYLYSLVQ